ncbi:oligopeptide ABC transporter solute-binding protein [Fictibacillus macauensis ZFHKF-1]|uniref:Oligopeptide ABC transporter solute-binding protein n=1 Tax=Fictibacillus macauensis ZFHKF-1 TaxID=1196324 RepID=I8AKV7_9BACL|nr:ABC transporter substrate-binding protein [Fictibacillus macauensis]EIT86229.1 oligopeptide ABC transporter solute-binding protein [Fictibacillus macauensis ZFHKF-1]
MEILDHYLTLRMHFSADQTSVTVAELESLFFCTKRNVNLLLRRMSEEEWITWTPGRGRGNRSTVEFHYPLEEAAHTHFSKLLQRNQMSEAADFLTRPLPKHIAKQLQKKIQSNFGFQVKETVAESLDLLKIPVRSVISTLDPAFSFTATEAHFVRQVFDTLIIHNPVTKQFEPHLAHHWTINETFTEWTFYLRKGVRFHHGRTLCAKDVVYTLNRLCDENVNSPYRDLFSIIESIEAFHDTAVYVKLSSPNAFFLHYLSSYHAPILPYDVPIAPDKSLIGTGAFYVKTHNERVLALEAFHDHFMGRPLLDRVEAWFMNVNPERVFHYELPGRETQNKRHVRIDHNGSHYLIFNFQVDGPHHDRYLREALHAIINRKKLVDDLGGRRRLPGNSFWQARSMEHEFAMVSPEAIAQLLEQSQYNGEPLILCCAQHTENLREARWLQAELRRYKIPLTIVPCAPSQFATMDAHLFLKGEILERDAHYGFLTFLKSQQTMRALMLPQHIETIDTLLEPFLRTNDEERRERITIEIEHYINREKLILHLYHGARQWYYPSPLAGIRLNDYGWADFKKLWIQPERYEEVRAGQGGGA